MKLLIIQPDIRQYRYEFFKVLEQFCTSLKIVHFGKPVENFLVQQEQGRLIQLFSFKWVVGLIRACRGYDHIVVGSDFHWVNLFFLSLVLGEKAIYWGHGLGKNRFVNWMRLLSAARAGAFITYDEAGREALIHMGLKPAKIFVANNTLSVLNTTDTSHEEKRYFLFIGRLQRRKRLDLIIRSLGQIPSRKTADLLIVGDGEAEAEYLRGICADEGLLNHVRFVPGTTDEALLLTYFKSAYAYVSPGHVGLGVLHSFAYGVPVVTLGGRKHAPEVSNLVHLENAYICEGEGDITNALQYCTDKRNAQRIGHNAYCWYSKNRTINHMVKGFLEAFEFVSKSSVREMKK